MGCAGLYSPPAAEAMFSSESSVDAAIKTPSTIMAGIGLLVLTPKLRMRSPMESALPFPAESFLTASL
jgi:hypothetical protein